MPRDRLSEDQETPSTVATETGSPGAAFITSAARFKRKATGCIDTASAEDDLSQDGDCVTPVKTIKLLRSFGWLPSSPAPDEPQRTSSTSSEETVDSTDSTPVSASGDAVALSYGGGIVRSPAWPPCPDLDDAADEEFSGPGWDFDPFFFIKRLPALHECVAQPRTEFLLPRRSRRSAPLKTLVLDLDETLVHSTLDGPTSPPDFAFTVEVGGVRHEVAVRQRPHLLAFLRRVAELYEVVVFTASQAVYAEQLLDLVDPARQFIQHRVFREACVQWEGNYLKDLTVLGRDLAHTIIVDNSPQAFGFQLENGIPIESWYDDDEDDELLKLLPFLEAAAAVQDVRPLIRSRFRLPELIQALPCQ